MQKKAFDILENSEGSWWDLGRQAAIKSVVSGSFGKILDYGAGLGSQFNFLKEFSPNLSAYEPEPSVAVKLKERGYVKIYTDREEALSGSYDLIAMLDVLEHVKDDKGLLSEIFSSLSGHGAVVVTVPAYQWLWSRHDDINMHFRRYTLSSLKDALEGAGFKINYIGYWNMALLIPLSIMRFLGSTGESGLRAPPAVNFVLTTWLRLEALIMKLFPLPFGVSLVALAGKK